MKNINVISCNAIESNVYVNPDLCHNGGGYHQPIYTIRFNDGRVAILMNDSCGDFTVEDAAYMKEIQKTTGIFVPINEDLMNKKEEENMCNSKKDEKFYAIVELLDERTRVRMEEEGVMPLDMDEDEENFWFAEAKSYVQDEEKDWEILLEYYPWLSE